MRYTGTQDQRASRQVNEHGRVSGTHRVLGLLASDALADVGVAVGEHTEHFGFGGRVRRDGLHVGAEQVVSTLGESSESFRAARRVRRGAGSDGLLGVVGQLFYQRRVADRVGRQRRSHRIVARDRQKLTDPRRTRI